MMEWWDSLDTVLKTLYCIALPSTLVLVIQTILSLLGGFEGGGGVDVSDTSGLDFQGGSDIGEMADAADMGGPGHFADGGNPADFSIMSMITLQGIVTFLTVMGLASMETSAFSSTAKLSRRTAISSPINASFTREGVPPPIKIEFT